MVAGLFKWLLPAMLSFTHPFYVSVTEIDHNAEDKTLEISCKLFTEDFESVLAANYKTSIDLSGEAKKADNGKLVWDYITHHLSLKVDGKAVTPEFVGFEKDKEAVWVYCQAGGIASFKKLEMTNTILHDFINTQINIIHVTQQGKRKSTKLDYPKSSAVFEF